MGGTYIHFSRSYEFDDYYFVLLIRFIRYEIINNLQLYGDTLGLKSFVADMEKYYWYTCPETVVEFSRYCGSPKTYPEFAKCLGRVKELLTSFGPEIPAEWKERLKVTPNDDSIPIHYPVKKIMYWLDCFRQAVEEYKPFVGVRTFPPPPD